MGDSYSEPVTNLIPGTHDKEISQVFKIIDKYTSDERIQEMIHELDTQICETINNALTYLAPKNKNFCRTRTYEYRKAHVISMQNDCAHAWFLAVFAELGLQMSTSMEQFILSLDKTKTQSQEKQATFVAKRKHAHGFSAKLKSEILLQRSEGSTYKSNICL